MAITPSIPDLAREIATLKRRVEALSRPGRARGASDWVFLDIGAGMVAFDSPPQARRIGGLVLLRGTVQRVDGTDLQQDDLLATLPADMAPSAYKRWCVACSILGTRTSGSTRVECHLDGQIVQGPDQDSSGPEWVSLDDIVYCPGG